MRIIIADCSVVYSGRGDTTLARGIRSIIIKEDGAVSIHSDAGNKPLNYMGKDNVLTIEEREDITVWSFDTRKESLQVYMHQKLMDSAFTLGVEDEGLVRDGTENQLQAWLSEHPEIFGEGCSLVQREFPTGAGPVDLLIQDKDGNYIAVEVKRVALLAAIDQINRYVIALRESEGFENTTGLIAALDVRPNTVTLANKRGIPYVLIPTDWNKKSLDTDTSL